ncbi:MAG: methyltransferase domain-containing protein [candidate division Zixibacteria bacterium]|nr:methyltransferase domain-containing protein [candidate division Zixibacteria bacterium]
MPSPYSLPQIYDIAFDFRDVKGECDFLLNVAQEHLGRPVRSALELACGPGYHTRELARRGIVSHGLDNSPEMVAYAQQLVAREKLDAEIIRGDMRAFESVEPYDLCYILIASFAHLLTNRDILDHLNAVADCLNDNGLYIISTAHPRDFYGPDSPSDHDPSWTTSGDGITVTTHWGGANQQFDPLTEIDDVVISFTVETGGQTTRHDFPERLRRLSFQTFQALVQQSGRFALVDMYGDFDRDIKISNDPSSVRFIPVLQKLP